LPASVHKINAMSSNEEYLDSDDEYDPLLDRPPTFQRKKNPPATPPVATKIAAVKAEAPSAPSSSCEGAAKESKSMLDSPKFCPRGCLFKCSYYSPPGVTEDWCPPIPPFHNAPAHCSGPCACSDVFWDDLILELENSDIPSYYMCLLECQDPSYLHLATPDKADVDLIVESYYWHAKAELAGMDLADVCVLDLPPCMCRMYANIDAIFTDFEEQKNQLTEDHEKLKRKVPKHQKKDRAAKNKRVLQF
jgi:hypothetical protein